MSDGRPLSVRGLCHAFGAVPTLTDVDLEVGRGQVVSVLGPSGSGKTTLLRSVAGFATPSRGEIRIGSVTVHADGKILVPAERRRVGMVFQDYALFPQMSVRENIAFGIHRDPGRHRRVEELLDLVGMSALADRRPPELSGGQQQRVALARALAPGPALLLLDEPFANLDADRRVRLIGELRRTLSRAGASALLVTHSREEALAMSDHVAVIGLDHDGGRLLHAGTPEEVYRRPASPEVAAITGEAQWVEGSGRGALADTPLGEMPLMDTLSGAVRVLVRPEQLVWQTEGGGPHEVRSRQFAGRGYRLWCATPAGELIVESATETAPSEGTRGRVAVRGACHAIPVQG